MLKNLYRIFLWCKLQVNKYLTDWSILNAGFVDNYYMVVLQNKEHEKEHKIIVDNIKNPIILPLSVEYGRRGYHVYNQNMLDSLPPKLINKLNKKGLFKTDNDERKPTARTSIHRLVYCIDDYCKGLDVHHIDKDVHRNEICNLVVVTPELNNKLEDIYTHEGRQQMLQEGYKLKAEREHQKSKVKKRYAKENEPLQLDIIRYGITHKVCDAVKKFRRFISTPQYIRDILNYFYYTTEFLEWLKSYSSKQYSRNDIDMLLNN